jgi:hypothetical protein
VDGQDYDMVAGHFAQDFATQRRDAVQHAPCAGEAACVVFIALLASLFNL